MNEWLAPWLNTVHVPYRAFAQESINQLDALLNGEPDRKIILPYELILRAP
jgi:LacI family transcriptional regulator